MNVLDTLNGAYHYLKKYEKVVDEQEKGKLNHLLKLIEFFSNGEEENSEELLEMINELKNEEEYHKTEETASWYAGVELGYKNMITFFLNQEHITEEEHAILFKEIANE